MDEYSAPLIASEEVRKNFIKSFILVAIVAVAVFAASWYLGDLLGDIRAGLITGLVITLVVLPIQILSAKWMILSMTRGRDIDPDIPQERRLLHLVQGLTISAGLKKTPDVYIIPTPVANAFASGLNEDSAFIGVTQGLLDQMNDQELEGVIAHEIAHIVHRDVMVCQIAASMQTAMLVLAEIIQWVGYIVAIFASTRSRNDRDDGGKEVIAGLLVYLLIKPVTFLISTLLTMSISRKREYAADAFAVRLCSYNEGLARALEKLSGDAPRYNGEIAAALGGNAVAPMYIYYPLDSLFSTHPPTEERIRRLRNMV